MVRAGVSHRHLSDHLSELVENTINDLEQSKVGKGGLEGLGGGGGGGGGGIGVEMLIGLDWNVIHWERWWSSQGQ